MSYSEKKLEKHLPCNIMSMKKTKVIDILVYTKEISYRLKHHNRDTKNHYDGNFAYAKLNYSL